MTEWFSPIDGAIGAGQDVVGGVGSTVYDTVLAPFSFAGDVIGEIGGGAGEAAGGLFGGLFGGIGNAIFQLAALALGGWILIQVV